MFRRIQIYTEYNYIQSAAVFHWHLSQVCIWGFIQALFIHFCLEVPGPPKAGISEQFGHIPQLGVLHPVHFLHPWNLCFFLHIVCAFLDNISDMLAPRNPLLMRFSVPRSQNTDPLIQSLSEPFVIWSIRYPIHSLSDPFVIRSIRYPIHSLSDTFVIRYISYPIQSLSDPIVIWSNRYPIQSLSDPIVIRSNRYLIQSLSIRLRDSSLV